MWAVVDGGGMVAEWERIWAGCALWGVLLGRSVSFCVEWNVVGAGKNVRS